MAHAINFHFGISLVRKYLLVWMNILILCNTYNVYQLCIHKSMSYRHWQSSFRQWYEQAYNVEANVAGGVLLCNIARIILADLRTN